MHRAVFFPAARLRSRLHPARFRIRRACVGALLLVVTRGLSGATLPDQAEGFFDNHCFGCHNDADFKGRLDLTALKFEPDDPANLERWVRIHDRVRAGEMPPKQKSRPAPDAVAAFVRLVGTDVSAAEHELTARDGRAVQRRLNRYEYENALRDLLHVPWVDIRDRLPQDGEARRYNKLGEALDVSHVQIARYLSAADHAMREAMSVQLASLAPATSRHYARDEPSLTRNMWPREGGTLTDRHAFPVLDSHAQPDVRAGRAPISSPETRDREAMGKVSSIFSDAGGYRWGQFRAPVGGRYRVRVKGYTVWVGGGGISRWFFEGTGEEKAPVYWLPLWHRPNLDEIWPGRRDEPMGVYAQAPGQQRLLGGFDFTPEPAAHELEVLLRPNEVIQTDGSRLFRTRVNGTNEQYINPLAQPDGMPGYAVQWIEVDGPLDGASPHPGYQLLFGDRKLVRLTDGVRGVRLDMVDPAPPPPPTRGPPRFTVPLLPVTVDVESATPRADAEQLLRAFLQRAYRRAVREVEVQRFLALFDQQLDAGNGFAHSLLTAYTAVLVSPGFLFVEEEPGPLDGPALATRLALFLWNSPPDEALRAAAAQGELHEPAGRRAAVDRLLDDPRSHRFVDAFTDYWLDLRKADDTSPSSTLYNDYELDDPLKQAALAETRLFVAELLRANRPARELIDSDFTFLNERLAQHYGIPGVSGVEMRRVTLPVDSVRGGLMTQASILKVTANGTTTSPVLRGHWITERILGIETPPPPPVPAVEPDIRGAVTIRQQLAQHRADPSCASCHQQMDPPGFALESFDVMGGWRERYRGVADHVPPVSGLGMNGQAFVFHHALPVDSAGELPDGRSFADIREFKRLLLADETVIARNLARQLTIYATGAPIRFSDRAVIEEILQETRASDHGVRSLVHAIVQSRLFREK